MQKWQAVWEVGRAAREPRGTTLQVLLTLVLLPHFQDSARVTAHSGEQESAHGPASTWGAHHLPFIFRSSGAIPPDQMPAY